VGQSHAKRRRRERPIKLHRRRAARELQAVCDALGECPSGERREAFVDEVVWLANPWAFSGIDAVIPAERSDLMRAWFSLRLVGVIDTPADVQRMARSFAPAPDDDFCPGQHYFGDPTSANVAAAYASRHRRRAHTKGGLLTSS
jgi:hypothetical protein